VFTNDRILCDDRCGAVFALRREEGLNRARQRARQDGWRWDGVGDWCPASLHRTRLTPGHDPLHGTELR
jgi:hypothetical protein